MSITDSDHVLVSTFNPDTDTIERVVAAPGLRLAFWTDEPAAGDRFRDGAMVMLRACSRSGKPDLEVPLVEGRSEVVTEGQLFDEVRAAVVERHGQAAVGEGILDNVRDLFGARDDPAYVIVVDITA